MRMYTGPGTLVTIHTKHEFSKRGTLKHVCKRAVVYFVDPGCGLHKRAVVERDTFPAVSVAVRRVMKLGNDVRLTDNGEMFIPT